MGATLFLAIRESNTVGHYLDEPASTAALCGVVPRNGWVRVEPMPGDYQPIGFCATCAQAAAHREKPVPA